MSYVASLPPFNFEDPVYFKAGLEELSSSSSCCCSDKNNNQMGSFVGR